MDDCNVVGGCREPVRRADGRLAVEAGQGHRAVCRRWRGGHPGAHRLGPSRADVRAVLRDRQSRRRRRPRRRASRRTFRAGRLHLRRVGDCAERDRPGHEPDTHVRSAEGFHPHSLSRRPAAGTARASVARREDVCRIPHADQEPPRGARLCLARHRHARAPVRRVLGAEGKHQARARTVQGLRAGAHRSHCRPRQGRHDGVGLGRGGNSNRRPARAGGLVGNARGRRPERAHLQGIGLSRPRRRDLVRPLGPGRNCSRHRAEAERRGRRRSSSWKTSRSGSRKMPSRSCR